VIAAVVLLVSPFAAFFLLRGGLAAADAVLMRRYPPPGQMISVGGHRLHLFCQGSGSPAVVIEPGLGVDWVSWSEIVTDLSQSVEVCVYDRAGYGWSDAGPMPRTAEQIASELHQLMTASHHARIVLVAHSFGGYVARVYAAKHAGTLGGMVLVDPPDHDPAALRPAPPTPFTWSVCGFIDRLPPLGWDRVKRLYRGEQVLSPSQRTQPLPYRQRVVIASSLDQLEAEQSELDSRLPSQLAANAAVFPADLPFVVITPAYLRPPADGDMTPTPAARRERHRRLAASAALGAQVFADQSGHFVHVDQPELVLRVIRDVLSRARSFE
jgi:pimeloyl-ACP methyl ester carboxylesterase